MNKQQRITPRLIIKLIEEGKPLPKSKTWHAFQEHLRTHPLTVKEFAQEIDIPLASMKKFLTGEFVINSKNLKNIQTYLQLHERCSDRICVGNK